MGAMAIGWAGAQLIVRVTMRRARRIWRGAATARWAMTRRFWTTRGAAFTCLTYCT